MERMTNERTRPCLSTGELCECLPGSTAEAHCAADVQGISERIVRITDHRTRYERELEAAGRRLLAAYEQEESEHGFPFNVELRAAHRDLAALLATEGTDDERS